ncbi:MAG: cytochrome c [Steroidobacteraceae bacterium]
MSIGSIRTVFATASTAVLLCLPIVGGGAEANRSAQQIEYRQSLYTVLGSNFGQMAAMVNGKMPYDPERFETLSKRVAMLATMLPEAFPAGSDRGARTEAKPEIWSKPEEFAALMKQLGVETTKLQNVAGQRDLASAKPAVAATGKVCKSCHNKFKTD